MVTPITEISIVHINVNGLRGKISEVNIFAKEYKPAILCFNETKLGKNKAPFIHEYKLVPRSDRDTDSGGGTAICARYDIQASEARCEGLIDTATADLKM